jgi:DNA-binding response OmpR family regulator
MRRHAPSRLTGLAHRVGDLEVNTAARRVSLAGRPVELRAREFAAGRPVSLPEIVTLRGHGFRFEPRG